ncbi:MAG: hypothetical protein KatS3mg087_1809 [Patescibacteria group bacterium]|nr:MAG: hypothetical protein KatS3mg087_1809 [Patescibacteria group bacterium]
MLRGLFTPLNLILGAIDFFAFSFTANVEGVENRAQSFVRNLQNAWKDLISGNLFTRLAKRSEKFFNDFSETFDLIARKGFDSPEVQKRLKEIGDVIKQWVTDTGKNLLVDVREFWAPVFFQWIAQTARDIAHALGAILNVILSFISDSARSFGDAIRNEWLPAFTRWWDEGGRTQLRETLESIGETTLSWIEDAATSISQRVGEWVPGFVDWVFDVLPKLSAGLGKVALEIGKWIIGYAPKLASEALKLGTSFIEWLGPIVADTIVGLGTWLGAVIRWILGDGIPGIVNAAKGFVGAIVSWVTGEEAPEGSAQAEIIKRLNEFLSSIKNFFSEHVIPALVIAGNEIVKGLMGGINELWQEVFIEPFTGLIESWYEDTKQAFKSKAMDIGRSIITGILEGIAEISARMLILTVGRTLTSTVIGAKDAIEAKSPSKLAARELGVPNHGGRRKRRI